MRKSRSNGGAEGLSQRISKLKKKKNAVILTHYYQRNEIQDIADFVGDSLDLSKKAASTDADIIVFAGVYFMAETAKILNPNKTVLIPDSNAGCSLETSCPPESYKAFIEQYPDHVKLTYINCSAEVKAMSDIICTSSNAEKIIAAIPKERPILFAPDKNLGRYLSRKTGREMLLWEGECAVHTAFSIDKILDIYREYPDIKIIAHPESEPHVLRVASFIGSTSKLLKFVQEDTNQKYLVATEPGIIYQMQQLLPNKDFIPAPGVEDNSCSCSECEFMKLNTLEKLYYCLLNESPEVKLSNNLRLAAEKPIKEMLEYS